MVTITKKIQFSKYVSYVTFMLYSLCKFQKKVYKNAHVYGPLKDELITGKLYSSEHILHIDRLIVDTLYHVSRYDLTIRTKNTV